MAQPPMPDAQAPRPEFRSRLHEVGCGPVCNCKPLLRGKRQTLSASLADALERDPACLKEVGREGNRRTPDNGLLSGHMGGASTPHRQTPAQSLHSKAGGVLVQMKFQRTASLMPIKRSLCQIYLLNSNNRFLTVKNPF